MHRYPAGGSVTPLFSFRWAPAPAIVEPDVVAAALAFDAIRELAKSPFVGFDQIAAASGNDALETLDSFLLWSLAQIRAQDKDCLVAPHAQSSFWIPAPSGEQGAKSGV